MGSNMNCAKAVLAWAQLFVIFSLVFLSLSFATDNWLEFDVDRDDLKTNDPTYHTSSSSDLKEGKVSHDRNVGLFRTCWPGSDIKFLDNAKDLVDGHCFERSFSMPEKSGTDYSANFKTRIHLIRCWLAFMVLGIAALIVSFIMGLVTCCWITLRRAGISATITFCAAFLAAASMAFFHGAYYLERSKINDDSEEKFELNWSNTLRDATSRKYGWSYILGWVGVASAVIAAIFFLLVAHVIKTEDRKDRELIRSEKYRPEYPPPMPYDYYPHAYPGPYVAGPPYVMELGGHTLPRGQRAIGYPEQQWSWS